MKLKQSYLLFLVLFPAINILKEREPGAFIIRDSHSFRGAYGLAMKVASPPPTVQPPKKGIIRSTTIASNGNYLTICS